MHASSSIDFTRHFNSGGPLVDKQFTRQFANVTVTQSGQVGLLTAFLYDSSGQTLLARSATVQLAIT
jgi:hypothetical protein